MNWTARYVGIPFIDGGRTSRGLDCWGLIRLAFLEECSIELPSYGEISALDLAKIAGMISKETMHSPWIPVQKESLHAFDVAVMFRRRYPVHVGLMVSSKEMLHVYEKASTVRVPLTSPTVAYPRIHFYRHEKLANEARAS